MTNERPIEQDSNLDIELSNEAGVQSIEQLGAQLSDLRTRINNIARGQQSYFEKDGNLERWITDMGDLQSKIGMTIVGIENAGGTTTYNSDEERVWANKMRGVVS